jgi:hypothetical protein
MTGDFIASVHRGTPGTAFFQLAMGSPSLTFAPLNAIVEPLITTVNIFSEGLLKEGASRTADPTSHTTNAQDDMPTPKENLRIIRLS